VQIAVWLDRSLFTFLENLFSIKTILKDFRVRFVSMELFFKSLVVTFAGIIYRNLSLWYNEERSYIEPRMEVQGEEYHGFRSSRILISSELCQDF
jgi:hypothetical protein